MIVKKKRNGKQGKIRKVEFKYLSLVFTGILALLGIIIYSNIFTNSVHFDDFIFINAMDITNLDKLGILFKINPLRIVTFVSFALTYHFFQDNLFPYYLTNILIHIINTIIVFFLIKLTLSTPSMKDKDISRHKEVLALLGALIFITHPLQTQAVTYLYQRLTSLSAMFYLLSIGLYLKARLFDGNKKRKFILFAFSGLAGIFSFFTKENTFTLPVILIMFEIFFFKREKSFNKKIIAFSLLIAAAGIFLFFLFYGPVRLLKPQMSLSGEEITSWKYFLTQSRVLLTYIRLLFLPINQNLDYDFFISRSLFELPVIVAFLLNFCLLGFGVYIFKRNRLISFAIFWFYITLAIESSIIPILDVINEHRLYIPMFGFSILMISLVYSLLGKKHFSAMAGIVVILCLLFSYMTFERNKVWKNELTLWSDVVSKSPEKPRPYNNRGLAYYNLGRYYEAIRDFKKAVELYPKYDDPHLNLGNTYGKLGQNDKALEEYEKVLKIDPRFVAAYYNRAKLLYGMGEYDKAIQDCKRSIRYARGTIFLGGYYKLLAAILEAKGKSAEAIWNYKKAASLNREDYESLEKVGEIYLNQGKFAKAKEYYSESLKINPDNAQAYINRGVVNYQLKNYEEALADLRKTIELKPNLAKAYSTIGVVYETMGKYILAIENYSHAIALEPRDYETRCNRGNALLKSGRIDEAEKDYNTALKLNPGSQSAIDGLKAIEKIRHRKPL